MSIFVLCLFNWPTIFFFPFSFVARSHFPNSVFFYRLSDPPIFGSHSSVSSHDVDAYLERVRSFTLAKWFQKPDSLSPLEAARFGWYNVDKDTLECRQCSMRLFVAFSEDLLDDPCKYPVCHPPCRLCTFCFFMAFILCCCLLCSKH